jgi:hypothetical protein
MFERGFGLMPSPERNKTDTERLAGGPEARRLFRYYLVFRLHRGDRSYRFWLESPDDRDAFADMHRLTPVNRGESEEMDP